MNKQKYSSPYDGQIKITTKIERRAVKGMCRARKLKEAAKKGFEKISIEKFIMSNAARVSFEVSRERWQEIEQLLEWVAVRGMVERDKQLQEA